MKELIITTPNHSLAEEIQSLNIEGVKAHRSIATFDCIDPESMIEANKIAYIVIEIVGTVGISLFSSWLYDRLKNKPSKQIKINGVEVSGLNNDVYIQINNYIKMHNQKE